MLKKYRNSKITLIFISLLLTISLIAGCGKSNSKGAKDVAEEKTEESETVAEDFEDDAEEDNAENDGKKDNATNDDNANEDETADETSDLSLQTIINNNGHFVQIGNKVYFHIGDADSFGKTSLWAKYSDTECGRTVLFEYDLKSGKLEILDYDYTSGTISATGDNLYYVAYEDDLNNQDNPKPFLSDYSLSKRSGTKASLFESDTLLGTGMGDSYVAAYHYEYNNNNPVNQLLIYDGEKLQNTLKLDSYAGCVCLGEADIFYLSGDYEVGYELRQKNVYSGEESILGRLPEFEDEGSRGYVDECIISDGKIYFTYSDYQGTGNFFSGGYFVQAELNKHDSLNYVNMPDRMVDGDSQPATFCVDNGQMIVSEGAPNSCEVMGNGELGYYDENGDWITVSEGWETVFLTDEGDYCGIEIAEKVGDYIFIIYNDNARAPEDDIGWRYAYYRNYTDVYCVSIETGETSQLLHQVAPWGE